MSRFRDITASQIVWHELLSSSLSGWAVSDSSSSLCESVICPRTSETLACALKQWRSACCLSSPSFKMPVEYAQYSDTRLYFHHIVTATTGFFEMRWQDLPIAPFTCAGLKVWVIRRLRKTRGFISELLHGCTAWSDAVGRMLQWDV